MLIITIKQGKEKSLLSGQPWIYASAIEKVEGSPREKNKPGATAVVQNSARQFIGRAAYNAKSQIAARIWTYQQDEPVDHALIKRRVKAAVQKRAEAVRAAPDQLMAVVRGDEDGLSGLLVDSYGGVGGYLVCQFQSAGADAWKIAIVQALIAETGCPNVYERCDELVRKGEGLPVFARALAGEAPPPYVNLKVDGKLVSMDLKTGFIFPKLKPL
ncbi:SAM-dependent methyltransferase [Oxalobacteraceae bacterium A2-2]